MARRSENGAGRRRRRLLSRIALIACLCGPSSGWAAENDAEDTALLRRVPGVADGLNSLPSFLRDTDLRLLLRTYYFNQLNTDSAVNEAWAGGAWLAYRSGWLLDTFQMGATAYTSIPLYAPDDRGGSGLLKPGQIGYIVPGVAYGALRYEEYALLTGYRQLVDQTYVNPQDNRMTPNTFEGVTLGGKVGFAEYLVGYLTRMKRRDADEFISMAEAAGVANNSGALVLAGLRLRPWKELTLQLSNQYGNDVFNTAYARVDYSRALARELRLTLSGQYTDQRAVGDDLLGGSKFRSWVTSVGGALAQLEYHGFALTGAFSVTGKGHNIQTPYGHYPGYLRMIVKDFDRAGEVAWLAGLTYDFPRGLPPGMRAELIFAQGTNAISASRRTPEPNEREYDVIVKYRAPKSSRLRGFGFEAAAGIVDIQGASNPSYQIRLIVNCEIPLL